MMGDEVSPEVRWGVGYSITLNDMHRITADIDGLYKMYREYADVSTLEPVANNLKGFGGIEYALLIKDWEIAVRGGGNRSMKRTFPSYGYAAGFGATYHGISIQYAFAGQTDADVGLGYSHRADIIIDIAQLVKM